MSVWRFALCIDLFCSMKLSMSIFADKDVDITDHRGIY